MRILISSLSSFHSDGVQKMSWITSRSLGQTGKVKNAMIGERYEVEPYSSIHGTKRLCALAKIFHNSGLKCINRIDFAITGSPRTKVS